jgi:hypothetical protein
MEEGGAHIHVMNIPSICSSKGYGDSNRDPFDDWSKCFFVVEPWLLFKTSSDKSCFLFRWGSVCTWFDAVHPSAGDRLHTFRINSVNSKSWDGAAVRGVNAKVNVVITQFDAGSSSFETATRR